MQCEPLGLETGGASRALKAGSCEELEAGSHSCVRGLVGSFYNSHHPESLAGRSKALAFLKLGLQEGQFSHAGNFLGDAPQQHAIMPFCLTRAASWGSRHFFVWMQKQRRGLLDWSPVLCQIRDFHAREIGRGGALHEVRLRPGPVYRVSQAQSHRRFQACSGSLL